MAMFGLVVIHHQTGVNDAGNPTEQSQQQTENETEDPASHQNGDRRKDDAEKVAECFQIAVSGVEGTFHATAKTRNHRLRADASAAPRQCVSSAQ